jgi:hypothetical protein
MVLPKSKTPVKRIVPVVPAKKQLVPEIIDKANIRRKIANKQEYENIDMKIYKYKKADMSVNSIRDFVGKIANKLSNAGLQIKVNTAIKTPIGWKSGRQSEGKTLIKTWTPTWGTNEDDDDDNITNWYDEGKGKVNEFYIFVQAFDPEGGRDENNDCLYNCLYSLLKETLTCKYDASWKLKQALHIANDAKINTNEHLDKIEKWLNVGIFLEGDKTRTPKIEVKNNIHLVFQDAHFSIKPTKKKHQPVNRYEERQPIFYHFNKENDNYTYYDGKLQQAPEDKFVKQILGQYKFDSEFFYIKCANKLNLQTEYDDFKLNADKLKDITKGRINMYRTGTIKNTALKLFYDLIQHVEEPESIDDNEAEFILSCYRSGLLYHQKYKGKAVKGDVCSMYPSLMSKQVMYPFKKGEFKTITAEDLSKMVDKKGNQYFKYGIYRAKIEAQIDDQNQILFKFNNLNHYSHIDMLQAHKFGFKIEMIQDEKANFLFYPTSSLQTGVTLFKKYVDFLFELKQKHPELKYIKRIMNILWGALCEMKFSSTHNLKNDIELKENEQIANFKVLNNGNLVVQCEVVGDKFLTGFARIGPFLTAYGRDMIANLALKHVKDLTNIKRIYVDCILSSEPLNINKKEQCGLGEFGLEHRMLEVEVVNIVTVKTEKTQ